MRTQSKNANPPDPHCAAIEMLPVAAPDGRVVYMCEREVGSAVMANGVMWLVDHPRETLHVAALCGVVAACVYLINEALRPSEPRARA
jgi:hypothetical protein